MYYLDELKENPAKIKEFVKSLMESLDEDDSEAIEIALRLSNPYLSYNFETKSIFFKDIIESERFLEKLN